jgi:hypothetical protein
LCGEIIWSPLLLLPKRSTTPLSAEQAPSLLVWRWYRVKYF